MDEQFGSSQYGFKLGVELDIIDINTLLFELALSILQHIKITSSPSKTYQEIKETLFNGRLWETQIWSYVIWLIATHGTMYICVRYRAALAGILNGLDGT